MAQRDQDPTSVSKMEHVRKMFVKRPIKPTRRMSLASSRMPAFLTQPDLRLIEKFSQILDYERAIAARPNAFLSQAATSHRNRYATIQPWAHNRVALDALAFPDNYINASPVTLGRQHRYIATQGPGTGQNADHFWRMVWQEEVQVIVMLTPFVEAGIPKCGVYLPTRMGDTLDLGPAFGRGYIQCLSRRNEDWAETRELRLCRVRPNMPVEQRRIYHLLFTGWPDHNVPRGEALAGLFSLMQLSRHLASSHTVPEPPRIIHCSAGIGRTGAFIALDHLLQELDDGKWDHLDDDDDPIFDAVKMLRDQRMGLVHTVGQFIFVYRILRDKWKTRNTQARAAVAMAENREMSSSSDMTI
ncbi:hypothetical protein K3495_g259 [Podosphaera aphanis]|nr:hypothetical protein K3495_g259 [Podosphaera aphanis]